MPKYNHNILIGSWCCCLTTITAVAFKITFSLPLCSVLYSLRWKVIVSEAIKYVRSLEALQVSASRSQTWGFSNLELSCQWRAILNWITATPSRHLPPVTLLHNVRETLEPSWGKGGGNQQQQPPHHYQPLQDSSAGVSRPNSLISLHQKKHNTNNLHTQLAKQSPFWP